MQAASNAALTRMSRRVYDQGRSIIYGCSISSSDSDTSAGLSNGDLIFNVCETPSPDFGIIDGEVEGEKAQPAYKVCARPSNEEIHQAFVSGGYDSLVKLLTQILI